MEAAAAAASPCAAGAAPGATALVPEDKAFQPISFVYRHLHNSIRTELDALEKLVISLHTVNAGEEAPPRLASQLKALQDQYRFVQEVYKYHSVVEDEVVYPALESKVQNVTFAYMVEHEDEERLLGELAGHLSHALAAVDPSPDASGHVPDPAEALQVFSCKVEQVHLTLRQHLLKEERQLFPLLTQHFSCDEQAALVGQFLCCIPLESMSSVLRWLKRGVPRTDLVALQRAIQAAPGGDLLKDAMVAWLEPEAGPDGAATATTAPTPADDDDDDGEAATDSADASPMDVVVHVHGAIRAALSSTVAEAADVRTSSSMSLASIEALQDRLRFLKQVYSFHLESEQRVMLPALAAAQRRAKGADRALAEVYARHTGDAHDADDGGAELDEIGRTLRQAVMHVRRGTRHGADLARTACTKCEAACNGIADHMTEEERDILPLLQQHLPRRRQRTLALRTLRAMPLRLLEHVLPRVGSQLPRGASDAVLDALRPADGAGGAADAALDALLRAWARGDDAGAAKGVVLGGVSGGPAGGVAVPGAKRPRSPGDGGAAAPPAQRRARAAPSAAADATHGGAGGSVLPEAPATPPSAGGARTQGPAPIDHIFGFHKALKNELAQLEDDAMSLGLGGAAIQEGALQRLAGRFRFLWGIYRAHSHAEDEVVFPALESKERLHNVTNSYAIDHQQEESLFCALDETLARVQDASLASSELGPLIASLQRQCAAIRAAVTLHVRSEEEGLWPLFVEHFTDEEQRQLVGTIIGRTGAEVLQAMLPWVTRSFTEEETGEMMDSLRQVTRKTRFDRWLGAIMATEGASSQEGSEHGCGGCAAAPGGSGHLVLPGGSGGAAGLDDPGQYPSEDELAPLKEVAQYLRRHGGLKDRLKAEVPEASGAVEDESSFEIGWEDLFLMNQNQLEGAVRRMSSDPSLDHSKRAYLIQNLMAAKYIVAQQLRMRRMRDGSVGPSAGSLATRSVELVGDGEPAAAAEPVGAPAAPAVRASRVEGAAPAAEGGAAGSGGAGSPADGAALRTYHDEARGVLGCEHYARSCKLVAPCCGKAYTCRLCHDDAEDHRMDRYAVRSMQCMRCGARGPVGQKCGACGESMASYYCGICHLFDGTEGRDIYHCPFCNTCRRGKGLGVDFFHCMKCNCCMSMTLMNKHQCREGQLESDCPICHELLFDSSQPVRALPCGHFMHSGCFRAYVQYSYTCPLCCKSVHLDMSLYINMIDAILAAERLPEQFAGQTQKIRCRDCERDGEAPFHFVYHKCQHCSSYNTVLR